MQVSSFHVLRVWCSVTVSVGIYLCHALNRLASSLRWAVAKLRVTMEQETLLMYIPLLCPNGWVSLHRGHGLGLSIRTSFCSEFAHCSQTHRVTASHALLQHPLACCMFRSVVLFVLPLLSTSHARHGGSWSLSWKFPYTVVSPAAFSCRVLLLSTTFRYASSCAPR